MLHLRFYNNVLHVRTPSGQYVPWRGSASYVQARNYHALRITPTGKRPPLRALRAKV